jgi:hypothetical protein
MKHFHLSDTGEIKEYNETVHQLFINFKKDYDSVRREILSPGYPKVLICKHLSDTFPIAES